MSHGAGENQSQEPSGFRGDSATGGRKTLWKVIKYTLTLIVLAFVASRAVALWREGSAGDVDLQIGWLFLAGVLYAVGWLPSAWYWKILLHRMGDDVAWGPLLRAYYVGHLGKYVPGKALVIVIRGQMAAAAGGRFRAGALAAVYDTLVMMGVGAEITIILIAYLLPAELEQSPLAVRALVTHPIGRWILEHSWVLSGAVLILVVATLPFVARLFTLVAKRLVPPNEAASLTRGIDAPLIGLGFVIFSVAWVIHGLGLWATLRGVGSTAAISDLPTWVASVAFPMVAGFAALFAPGGVGVREGLLIEVLQVQPGVDARQAVAAAFLLRFVGLVTEVAVAAALYYGLAPPTPARPDLEVDATRLP